MMGIKTGLFASSLIMTLVGGFYTIDFNADIENKNNNATLMAANLSINDTASKLLTKAGNGSGNEPPVKPSGNGSGNEPPVKSSGNGSGNEPPVKPNGNGSGNEPPVKPNGNGSGNEPP
jgi:hypothetical protein